MPHKLLVWAGDEGSTQISYNSEAYLQARHSVPQALTEKIATVESLAAMASE